MGYCRWLQESPSPRRLCDCFEKLDEQSGCGCCPRTSQLPATPGSEHKIDATRLQATACLIDVGTAVSSPSAVAATWTCRSVIEGRIFALFSACAHACQERFRCV